VTGNSDVCTVAVVGRWLDIFHSVVLALLCPDADFKSRAGLRGCKN